MEELLRVVFIFKKSFIITTEVVGCDAEWLLIPSPTTVKRPVMTAITLNPFLGTQTFVRKIASPRRVEYETDETPEIDVR